MNNGMIVEQEWKGLSLKDAIYKAKVSGMTHRIVEEDGRSLMVDAQAKNNRVNLRLRNGKVIGAFPG